MKKLFLAFLASMLFFIAPSAAFANTSYSINRLPSGADRNESSAYFDLRMEPGQQETIQTVIHNTSDTEITVRNSVFASFTNANGEIDYTRQADEYDDSLVIKMSDIATVRASDIDAVVAPGERRTVSVDIHVPDNAPNGVILGSWHFEDQEQDASGGEGGGGIAIDSRYAYALAIRLLVNEEVPGPNLNLLDITSGLNNYRKAFLARIQNDMPALTTRVTIEARVTNRGEFDTLWSNTMENVAFAPNSNFQFPVFLGEDLMTAGEFTYRITAVTQDPKDGFTGQQWQWDMDFTVLPEEAAQINAAAINDPVPPRTWLDYLRDFWWIGLIAAVILFLIFFLIKRRKKDDEDKNQGSTISADEDLLNDLEDLLK